MPTPIDRRDSLRLGLLALAAAGAGGLLSACDGSPDEKGRGSTGPEPSSLGRIELVSSDVERSAGDPALLAQVVAGLQSFAGGLYGTLAAQQGNLVLSPYSVLVALGMTLAGARGQTATEMRDLLGVGDLGDRWHEGVNALLSYVDGLAGQQKRADDSTAEIALATANQIFGQRGVSWEEEFLDVLAREYGAALRAVDFEHAAEQARALINGWVEQQTHDRIKDLVPEGTLDALTRLVLVNAIYLKAPWEKPFEKAATVKAPFHLDDGSTVEVDLMSGSGGSRVLVEGEGWRGARMAYAGQRLAMTVVLPDAGRLGEVEATLAKSGFDRVTTGGRASAVTVKLPRWTFRTEAPLGELLKELGMSTAFDAGKADFTGMAREEQLAVGDVLHQGFVAVDEEGTEAAAATAVVMEVTGMPVTEELVVDRPFLFVIHDVEHGTPLFVGRVSDPTA